MPRDTKANKELEKFTRVQFFHPYLIGYIIYAHNNFINIQAYYSLPFVIIFTSILTLNFLHHLCMKFKILNQFVHLNKKIKFSKGYKN